MKTILLLLLPTLSFGQVTDSAAHARIDWCKDNITDVRKSLYLSGTEMQKFYHQHMIGICLSSAGSIITTFSVLPSKNGGTSPFVYVGATITFAGIITELFSPYHIYKAGDALKYAGIPSD